MILEFASRFGGFDDIAVQLLPGLVRQDDAVVLVEQDEMLGQSVDGLGEKFEARCRGVAFHWLGRIP